MATYLEQYGAGDERHIRNIRRIVWGVLGAIAVAILAYFIFHNLREKHVAKEFLADINAHNYRAAYDMFCPAAHPCPNYDFNRFERDWGPDSKATAPWKITSTDSCKYFLTVNVDAPGAEMQSLAIQRDGLVLGYAPAPECQEKKWRWKQFWNRLTGHQPKPQGT